MSDFEIQLLALIVAAPWWWPVVKRMWSEAWNAGTEDRSSELDEMTERRPRRRDPRLWSDGGPGWSKKRVINTQWDTGRKPAARQRGFGASPERRGGFGSRRRAG